MLRVREFIGGGTGERRRLRTGDTENDYHEGGEDREDDDAESIGSSKSKDQLMNVVTTSSPKSGVKITGTIKMMKPLEVQPSKSFLKTIYKDLEDQDTEYSEKGCMHSAQRWAVTIWSTLFD